MMLIVECSVRSSHFFWDWSLLSFAWGCRIALKYLVVRFVALIPLHLFCI